MIDKTDKAIVSRLQFDGRMPLTKIAAEIGITEGAVRRRVKRLLESGIMQVVAIVKPEEMGWSEAAMIGIKVKSGQVEPVARQIANFREVTYLFMAAGEFDLFAEVFCRDREHFVSFLNERLQKVPGVEQTQTFVILKMHKLPYRWGQAVPEDADSRPSHIVE